MALTDKLTAIADAIRAKTGGTAALTLEQMPTEIAGIKGSTPQPACEVKVIPASTDSHYLNHAHLPEIPANVEYPYLLVRQSETTITLWTCKSKMFYEVREDGTRQITIPDAAIRRTLDTTANAWVVNGVFTSSWFGVEGSENWAVWWSNYDIPKGSADATEIYWYASTPQAEQPADATHFYYNGVRLPAIPTDLLAQYPCAWIRKNTNTGYYDLVLCEVYFYYDPNTLCLYDSNYKPKYHYQIEIAKAETATEWVFNQEFAGGFVVDDARPCIWTNTNILNGSTTATEIYLQGTLAVPDPLQGGV